MRSLTAALGPRRQATPAFAGASSAAPSVLLRGERARRAFWARQCALSALAIQGGVKTRDPLWKQLALVGREIASDARLDRIPLMKQVAEESVWVFESQM